MPKVDPRDFLLNTDYEMDKIIYVNTLQRTASTSTKYTIPHKLKTVPLVFGIWSNNADYSNSHELSAYVDFTNSPPCIVSADLTNIYITLNPRQSNQTFYMRIFGFEPYSEHEVPGWQEPKITHQKLPTTSKHAKTFILNTDYNYLKLLKAGTPLKWDPNRACMAYSHNLNYVPQILLWSSFGWTDNNGNIEFRPQTTFSHVNNSISSLSGFFVNTKEVAYYSGIVPLDSEVRIYADEA